VTLLKAVANGQSRFRPPSGILQFSTKHNTITARKDRPGVKKFLKNVVGIKGATEIARVRARKGTAVTVKTILRRLNNFTNLDEHHAKDAGAALVQGAEFADILGCTMAPKAKTPPGLDGQPVAHMICMCSQGSRAVWRDTGERVEDCRDELEQLRLEVADSRAWREASFKGLCPEVTEWVAAQGGPARVLQVSVFGTVLPPPPPLPSAFPPRFLAAMYPLPIHRNAPLHFSMLATSCALTDMYVVQCRACRGR
jgi:hypothetical protein